MVHRRLGRGHDVEIVETNRRGHATRFAHDAARRGLDVVVGYGGDGTLNEVATGIAGTDTALGVLPGRIDQRVRRARSACPTIRSPRSSTWRTASTPPIFVRSDSARSTAATSASTPASASTPRSSNAWRSAASMKRWLGHPLFISAGVSTWMTGYDRRTPHFRVHGDGGATSIDGYFTIVLNTNPYTYLGNRPLDLSPAATLDRGLVAITFKTMSATAILTSLGRRAARWRCAAGRSPRHPHRRVTT